MMHILSNDGWLKHRLPSFLLSFCIINFHCTFFHRFKQIHWQMEFWFPCKHAPQLEHRCRWYFNTNVHLLKFKKPSELFHQLDADDDFVFCGWKIVTLRDDEKLSLNKKHLSFVSVALDERKEAFHNKSLQLKSKVKLINYCQHFSPHFSSLKVSGRKSWNNFVDGKVFWWSRARKGLSWGGRVGEKVLTLGLRLSWINFFWNFWDLVKNWLQFFEGRNWD